MNIEMVFNKLADFIFQMDAKWNTPTGILIGADGRFYVKYYAKVSTVHVTFKDAVKEIAEFLNSQNEGRPGWTPL